MIEYDAYTKPEPICVADETIEIWLLDYLTVKQRDMFDNLLYCQLYRGLNTCHFYLRYGTTLYTNESKSIYDLPKLIENVAKKVEIESREE